MSEKKVLTKGESHYIKTQYLGLRIHVVEKNAPPTIDLKGQSIVERKNRQIKKVLLEKSLQQKKRSVCKDMTSGFHSKFMWMKRMHHRLLT